MKTKQSNPARLLLGALLLAGASLAAAQSMKPGLWEVKTQLALDPQQQAKMDEARKQLANLPPDQRKMVESMMAQQGVKVNLADGGMSAKICLTKADVERGEVPYDRRGDCTHDVKRSGNTMNLKFTCTNPQSSGEGTYTFNGDSAYTMKMRVTTTEKGGPKTADMSGSGQWLGADCQGIRPISEMQKR